VLLAPRAVATTVLNSVNYINYRSTCIYYFRDKDCWSLMLNTYLFTLTEFGNDYLQFFFCLLVLVMMTVFWSRFFFFFYVINDYYVFATLIYVLVTPFQIHRLLNMSYRTIGERLPGKDLKVSCHNLV
jgi:hypothetical protein